jgi:hypothetical protein
MFKILSGPVNLGICAALKQPYLLDAQQKPMR